ncbi:MAG TPA: hypothetical protein ENO18_02090, partial [Caldithrix sp.]|nr:hypothetical protein [Caldithrix sp.]
MPEGKDTFFENKKVFDLVADGGAYEDQPPRWMAHFHNPLTNKGLLGSASALAWAIAPAGAQTTFPPTGTGTYSWYDARSYFEQALISKDKKTRENYFALAFRSIGQVMHVVQDMSVPAHTRGDIHPSLLNIGGDDYEKWAKKNIKGVTQGSAYSPYNNSMFLIPQLFDTDQYNGTNPSITISNSIGLAEFTNANFMSADTIFKDFDYPNKSNLQMYPKEVSPGKWAVYYTKTIDGLGEVKHFVREKSYYDKLPTSEAFRGLMLDDSVNSDYAQHLIPRAVGYSAQVLQYFFRGQLEAEFVEGNLKVKNTSSETISNGEFSLYYDNASEERNLLVTAQADNLPSGSEQTITIPEIPEGATSFMLVYKGKLGNEENAVIGKVIPSEFVVITVSLSGISGENLTKKTVFVWNPASNSLVRAPIDNADTNFQAWRENRTVTGNTLFGPLQECGTKVGFGADNLTDRCDVIKKGLVDTSVNNGYSYYVPKSWNPPVEEHYVFVYDYESMNHAVSGFWELGMTGISAFVYPKSFYCAVFLPQNQNNFSGLRTSRWRKITGISTAGDSVLNYPYTGDTHEEWIDTFVGPLGTMGEFRGYRDYEFSTHDYYHEDKYY